MKAARFCRKNPAVKFFFIQVLVSRENGFPTLYATSINLDKTKAERELKMKNIYFLVTKRNLAYICVINFEQIGLDARLEWVVKRLLDIYLYNKENVDLM